MIFDNPIFTEMILPFVLIFVLVFAILQRTKILGEGKKQNDSLVALAIGLLLIGVPVARNVVIDVVPWMAVGMVFLLFFFLLYGFGEKDVLDGVANTKWIKNMLQYGAVAFIALVIIFVTPLGTFLLDFSDSYSNSGIWANIFMIAIIIGVIAVALSGKNDNSSSS